MTRHTSLREKARAVFLATLMVVSVFGGTVALAGSAAASSGANPSPDVDPGDLEVSIINSDGTANATYRVNQTTDTINVSYAGGKQDVNVSFSEGNSSDAIQFAIDNATEEYNTVVIGPGTYNGSVTVDSADSGVALTGDDGAKVVGDGIDTGSQPYATIFVEAGATDVSVSGLTISNPNGTYGIEAGDGTAGGDVSGLSVTNNEFVDIGTGLSASDLDGIGEPLHGNLAAMYVRANFDELEFSDNTIQSVTARGSGNGSAGFSLKSDPDSNGAVDVSTDLVVNDNVIADVSGDSGRTKAISVNGEIDGVEVVNNSISGVSDGDSGDALGISVTEIGPKSERDDIDGDGQAEALGPKNFTIEENDISGINADRETTVLIGGYEQLGDSHVVSNNDLSGGNVERIAEDQRNFSIDDADVLNLNDNSIDVSSGAFAVAVGNGTGVSGNTITAGGVDVAVTRNVDDPNGQIVSLYEENTNVVNVSLEVNGIQRIDQPGNPTVTDATFLDSDDNGDIDAVNVTFDEPVRDDSLDAAEFTIGGTPFDNVSTVANGSADAYDDKIRLTLDEDNEVDGTSLDSSTGISASESSVTDLSGNGPDFIDQSNVTDGAEPVVEAVEFDPAAVNNSATPNSVGVDVTYSEPVSNTTGTFTLSNEASIDDPEVQSADGNTVSASANVGSLDRSVDEELTLTVNRIAQDNAGNAQIDFSQSDALEVDLEVPDLATNTITTLDSDSDGAVEQLEVEFNDNVSDDSVEPADFEVTDPDTPVDSVDTGAVENDNIVLLNVSELPADNTTVTPNVTVFADSTEDTAGNVGPENDTTQRSVDGAAPAVLELTVNDTGDGQTASETVVINDSDTPAPVEVNATFSENLTTDPTVSILNADGSERTGTTSTGTTDDNETSVVSNSSIVDNDEETELFVNVSGGGDGKGNAVDFNESRITVDTVAPTTSVDNTILDGIQDGTVDISDNVSVTGDDVEEIVVDVDDGEGGDTFRFASESALNDSLSSFDTTQFDDGTLVITVNATDDAGNTGPNASGSFDVDNTAPEITINEPSDTTAAPTGGELRLNATVDEPNVDGNATVVLEGDGNTIQYNVSEKDLESGVDLRLNTSENASADGARLPNLSETNGSFDTQTVYNLSVTVDDTTGGEPTTATQEDALFLDDTSPANFSLIAPDDPVEVDPGVDSEDDIQIAYGYTEDNVGSVEVSLTRNGSAVANSTVDESQYVDDGVIKGIELSLYSFDNSSPVADGRYNVSVTVTDQAGNELTDSTDDAPVYLNDVEEDNGNVTVNEVDATADLNGTSEQVTVNVTYNVSVENLEDAGDLGQVEAQLQDVTVGAGDGLVTASARYYDEDNETYASDSTDIPIESSEFENVRVVENETVTATATTTVNVSEQLADDNDRVLDYTVSVDGSEPVFVIADANVEGDNSADTVDADSATLIDNDPVAPEIESVEVTGPDASGDELRITFSRPVDNIGRHTADDYGYQDVSGDGENFVTSVDAPTGDTTITVELEDPVDASDVGEDIVSIQPDVLENPESDLNVSADNGTVEETTAPSIDDSELGEDTSTVTVAFDQGAFAADGGNLTATNVSYTGAANVTEVDHEAGSETVTVTLDASVTTDELGNARVEFDAVADQFDNVAELSTIVSDAQEPSGIEIVEPGDRTIKQSDGVLDVTYEYTENVPENTESVTVTLIGAENGETYTYEIDDSQYVDEGATKSLTLDLDSVVGDELADGAYSVAVSATDGSDNTRTVQTDPVVVINDVGPDVTGVDVTPEEDVAPDETVNVSYDSINPGVNTSSVIVHIVDADDAGNFSSGDFANVSTPPAQVLKTDDVNDGTVSVDLDGRVDDNEEYVVFVTATDESGLTNLNTSANPIIQQESAVSSDTLDVNDARPEIDSVEANVGDDEVTVQFSEDVVAADGDVSADDFAYQDVSAGGASSIEEVLAHGDGTVTLRLDGEVSETDLESDLVSAREGAITDTDADDPRVVDSGETVALGDTTSPGAPDIEAATVNQNNEESYEVTVTAAGDEPVSATVTVTDGDGSVNATLTEFVGSETATLNVSELSDGQLTVEVTVTDDGGNSETTDTTVEKDTDAPEVLSASTDVTESVVTVVVDERLDTPEADDFAVSSPDHEVDRVFDQRERSNGQIAVALLLNETVPPEANGTVTVSGDGATDEAGNALTGSAALVDDSGPFITGVSAEEGSDVITVAVDEDVGDAANVAAADFDYVDADGAGAGNVTSVDTTDANTFELTLDENVTASDLEGDRVALNESLVDTLGNAAFTSERSISDQRFPQVDTETDERTITVTVTTTANLSEANLSATVTGTNSLAPTEPTESFGLGADAPSTDGGEFREQFTQNLSEDAFEQVGPDTYEANVSVPADGRYDVTATVSSDGLIESSGTTTAVDAADPTVTDAVVLDAGGLTIGNERVTATAIHVTFSEPVDLSAVDSREISIDGVDSEDIIQVNRLGNTGSLVIYVEGEVQTGNSPDVTVDNGSVVERFGDRSTGVNTSTTVHSDVLNLPEGKSLVSVPAAAGSVDLEELDLTGVDVIYGYDGETDSFEVYDPDAPENDFDELEGGEGYIFVMDQSRSIAVNVDTVAGASAGAGLGSPAPNAVELSEGWNLIGHFQEGAQPVPVALSSVEDDSVFQVLAQQDTGFAYESFRAGDFETMERGEAYWIFVTDDEVYTEAPYRSNQPVAQS